MKYLLAVSLVLLGVVNVQAQEFQNGTRVLPVVLGCYMTPQSYPSCDLRKPLCSGDYFTNEYNYGTGIALLCDDWLGAAGQANANSNQLNTCINDYNGLVAGYNANLGVMDAQDTLIRKLKKRVRKWKKKAKRR